MSDNFGFSGAVPPGVSVAENISLAKQYQEKHTPQETIYWFYEHVRNNKDGHLSKDQSMDYKQIDPQYADFGNFNYGAVGRALGIPDSVLEYGAGWAQCVSGGMNWAEALARALSDPVNKGDNLGDQELIREGINAARRQGYGSTDFGICDDLKQEIVDKWRDLVRSLGYNGSIDRSDSTHSTVSTLFASAQSYVVPPPPRYYDPLVFDLDGDGIETVAPGGANTVLFDHDGDGMRIGTGWVGPDDGLLVRDHNGNGLIDSGREMYGHSTQLPDGTTPEDGFAALASEDTNGDGVVNNQDANWSSLRIWRDLNQDGISQSEELSTLESLNIASISLAKTEHSSVLPGGNELADLGTFTRTDGTTGQMADLNMALDSFRREFVDSITITEIAAGLPDMHGSGVVRDLREAA